MPEIVEAKARHSRLLSDVPPRAAPAHHTFCGIGSRLAFGTGEHVPVLRKVIAEQQFGSFSQAEYYCQRILIKWYDAISSRSFSSAYGERKVHEINVAPAQSPN